MTLRIKRGLIIAYQCQYYAKKRPLWVCAVIYVLCLALLGGLQAAFVYAIRVGHINYECRRDAHFNLCSRRMNAETKPASSSSA